MKGLLLFLLVLLILAACSPIVLETPTVTSPAPTQKPTVISTPTETPDPRFKELLPETSAKCMEQNVINWKSRDSDLSMLIKKVKEQSVFPHEVKFFASDIWENLSKEGKENDYIDIHLLNPDGIFISACGGSKENDGNTYPFFVIALKRYPYEDIDYLTMEGIYLPEELYQKVKQGNAISDFDFGIQLQRGKTPETNEKIKKFLDLIPAEPGEAEKYRQNLKDYFNHDHTPFPEEKMNMLRSFINGRIFPLSSFTAYSSEHLNR